MGSDTTVRLAWVSSAPRTPFATSIHPPSCSLHWQDNGPGSKLRAPGDSSEACYQALPGRRPYLHSGCFTDRENGTL